MVEFPAYGAFECRELAASEGSLQRCTAPARLSVEAPRCAPCLEANAAAALHILHLHIRTSSTLNNLPAQARKRHRAPAASRSLPGARAPSPSRATGAWISTATSSRTLLLIPNPHSQATSPRADLSRVLAHRNPQASTARSTRPDQRARLSHQRPKACLAGNVHRVLRCVRPRR